MKKNIYINSDIYIYLNFYSAAVVVVVVYWGGGHHSAQVIKEHRLRCGVFCWPQQDSLKKTV